MTTRNFFKQRFWIFALAKPGRKYAAVSGWHHIAGRLWIRGRNRPAHSCCTPFDLLADALRGREFEAEGWRDYAIIPLSLARWVWAWIFWRFVLILARVFRRYPLAYSWVGCSPNGRWTSPEPTVCPRCLWAGQRRQCEHGYTEWEAEDYCPRCGRDI